MALNNGNCVCVEGAFPAQQHQIKQNSFEMSQVLILSIFRHQSSNASRVPKRKKEMKKEVKTFSQSRLITAKDHGKVLQSRR